MTTPWWAFAVCVAAVTPYALFVIFYAARSPWYANAVGRSLMLSKFVIMMLLGHVLVVLSIGDYPGRLPVWATLFVLTSVAGTWQLLTLLRLQRRIDHGEHPRRRQSDYRKEKHL